MANLFQKVWYKLIYKNVTFGFNRYESDILEFILLELGDDERFIISEQIKRLRYIARYKSGRLAALWLNKNLIARLQRHDSSFCLASVRLSSGPTLLEANLIFSYGVIEMIQFTKIPQEGMRIEGISLRPEIFFDMENELLDDSC